MKAPEGRYRAVRSCSPVDKPDHSEHADDECREQWGTRFAEARAKEGEDEDSSRNAEGAVGSDPEAEAPNGVLVCPARTAPSHVVAHDR